MKRILIIVLYFLTLYSIFAQKHSIDLNYSGLLTSRNVESVSEYAISGNYFLNEYNLSVGLEFSSIDSKVNFNVLKHPSLLLDVFEESAPSLGINTKYYPRILDIQSYLKPFIGFGMGWYLNKKVFGYFGNMVTSLEKSSYNFSNSIYPYINFNIGSIIFPENILSFVFNIHYQIRKPKITYTKNYILNSKSIEEKYTETVDLSVLMWSVGVRVNF